MPSPVKFLIVFISVFSSVFLVREFAGHGLLSLADCNSRHDSLRCMHVNTSKATMPIQDMYHFVNKGELDKAWNIIPEDIQKTFIRAKGDIPNKDYFHQFWDVEIENFTFLRTDHESISSKSATVSVDVCYLRNQKFTQSHQQPQQRFCSHNVYDLQKRKNDTPYDWVIDTFKDYPCHGPLSRACDNHDFTQPSQLEVEE